MLKYVFLALSAILVGTAHASASASASASAQSEGTVTCEWGEKAYDAETAKQVRSTFTRTSDNKVVAVGKDVSIETTNSSSGYIMVVLRMKSPRAGDVQNYVCVVSSGSENVTQVQPLRSRPIPRTPPVSQTILEGQPFTFDCSCASSSQYNATKFKFTNSSGTYDVESLASGVVLNSSENAVWIGAVRSEHRGEYSCEAANDNGMTAIRVRLRVKSPLAAVWPAIGIFAEVVVLVVIVLIYERRRTKMKNSEPVVANDDDDDNGRGHNNASGGDKKGGSGDVRQRPKA